MSRFFSHKFWALRISKTPPLFFYSGFSLSFFLLTVALHLFKDSEKLRPPLFMFAVYRLEWSGDSIHCVCVGMSLSLSLSLSHPLFAFPFLLSLFLLFFLPYPLVLPLVLVLVLVLLLIFSFVFTSENEHPYIW
jgi:hypothetical protein